MDRPGGAPLPSLLTRRLFIGRGVALATVAATAGYAELAFPAAPAGALGERHRRSLKALVEALARAPGSRFKAGDASRVAAKIAGDLGAQPESSRLSVEAALDRLDAGRAPGSFSSLPASARLASLRRQAPRDQLVRGAIRLAASAVYPADDPVAIAWAP